MTDRNVAGGSVVACLGTWLCLLGAGCGPAHRIEVDKVPDDIFAPIGAVVPYASDEEKATFDRGLKVAQAPLQLQAEGLGPRFNLVSCGGCHERPTTGGAGARYRNLLLVQQKLEDGSQAPVGINGIQTQFSLETARGADAEGANVHALRNPIPAIGVVALAEIPEKSILANQDPDDKDGDGISGRLNYDRGFVGRFGRKAQTVSIEGFIRGPLFNHIGITSNPLSNARKAELPVPSAAAGASGSVQAGLRDDGISVVTAGQAAAPDMPNMDDDDAPDPELSEDDLFDVVSFTMLLAVPRPDEPTAESEAGSELFSELGCDGCHVRALKGPRGLIPAYSDLLLHDMGDDLADDIVMGVAKGNEFRTQPLWGVVAVGPYLHDGRADTLDDAIRFHGGEAKAARDAYVALDGRKRRQVLAFLASLGGGDQRSDGLLPPDAAVEAVGEFGGPMTMLTETESALYAAGRAVFDRDTHLGSGLGPEFNGDSCRACHFDPVLGGAGPADVDVTRQGIRSGDQVAEPAGGTMARHFDVSPMRPPIDAASNIFERRQTPALFGLGLIDAIPDEVILANADPDDENGDGIRGRAHVLADNRIGRFGWRADVPSLVEFTRDAFTNELGVTVPEEEGACTFGLTADADGVDDPEIPSDDLAALRFFMAELAPPPRTNLDDPDVVKGEMVFDEVGCASCHHSLALADDTEVALYSDLLLHDICAEGEVGVGSGSATGREMRTAPLWGISHSAPYFHDGRAETLEAAIAAHAGEALASATAVSELSDTERRRLLTFLESL